MYFLPRNIFQDDHEMNAPSKSAVYVTRSRKTPLLADPSTSSCPLSGNS